MSSVFDCVVLIPSLHPDEKLLHYVQGLQEHGFHSILVVDDGSGDKYQDIFKQIANFESCTVIGYEKNKGKGHALKHGMRYILEHYKGTPGVITADSDGQHTVDGVMGVAQKMLEKPSALVLGSRNLKEDNVPFRSRFGNTLTSFFFALLYGHYLPDTQTGLRGISTELIPDMLKIDGNRFEYEMNMLTVCALKKIPFEIVGIKTIYIEENKSSHFNPIKDSLRIYKHLFGNFFKYLFSSFASFLIDIGVFTLLDAFLLKALFTNNLGGQDAYLHTYVATAVARITSATFNYFLNKKIVFNNGQKRGSGLRYATLAIASLLVSGGASNSIYRLFSQKVNKSFIKAVVDTVLYFVNYRIQKAWVFPYADNKEKNNVKKN